MLDFAKLHRAFYRFGALILRFRAAALAGFLLLTVLAGAGLPHLRADTSQESWFLEGDAILEAKRRFEDIFGNDDFCSVLVRADNIFTTENLTLIKELGQELERRVPYAEDVLSLAEFEYTLGTEDGLEIIHLVPDRVEDIPRDAASLNRIRELALAKPLLRNRLVSEDGREAWIILRLKPLPEESEENGDSPGLRLARAIEEVASQDKYSSLSPLTAGLPVIDLEKREYFGRETPRLIGISLITVMIVLGVALRSARGVLFPLLAAGSAILIVLGVQGHLRVSMDPITVFLPIFLSLALATCYSVHIINFFSREMARTGKRGESLIFAVGETGWPLLFSSLTTIAALLCFLAVPMRPIRWVGLTAACLVGVTWLLVTILLPALLSFGKDRAPAGQGKPVRQGWLDRLMNALGRRVLKRPALSLALFGLMAVAGVAGMARFEISFDIRRTSGPDVPYVHKLITIGETLVGSIYSYGVAIEFPRPDMAKEPENLEKLRLLGEEVLTFPHTKKISYLVDIIKDMNQTLHDGDPAWHRIPQTREEIAQLLLLYENAGGREAEKWVDYDYQRLRLQVEVDDYNSAQILRELDTVRQRCAELFPGSTIIMTGSLYQFSVMMDYVTWGQVHSYFLALLIITGLMALAFGSFRVGLISMIPNCAPCFAVGAIMGFMGIPLDMMTVTIIPMLLGLAVDDTIHFISHSRLEFLRTGSYSQSTLRSFQTVGRAMFITSVILVLGFSSYLTSDVNVFVNMGFLIGAGIMAALLADYCITPVLLQMTRSFGPESVGRAKARKEESRAVPSALDPETATAG